MKVALGVTGGIAAYKAAEIVRLLQDRGIRVQVIMTRSAQEFVRPLTFAALSGEKVITGMFSPGEEQAANIDSAIEHIAVAQSIDLLVVAPATADLLAKMARGHADDFLSRDRDVIGADALWGHHHIAADEQIDHAIPPQSAGIIPRPEGRGKGEARWSGCSMWW